MFDASPGFSQFPADYSPSGFLVEGIQSPPRPLVRISNVQVAQAIRVKSVKGQIVTAETSVLPVSTPGVSPWGLLVLFGVLLLAGSWILQRRHRLAMMG